MSDADDKFVHATDSLLALYRSVERSTLDLPVVSFMPMLIFIWAALRFYFFLVIGLVLIIPVNLVILIRNIFPGHWRYRPFFLSHLYYVWLWIWRGEVPTFPLIFFRPLLSIFIKAHFETRLRRLRLEVLDSELSDGTRSTLLGRLDAALERWKSPRTGAIFYTVILPGIISLPTWYKQLIEFLESVRKHQAGLQSFRSMRRIEASRRNASALRLRFSQSLASLRQRLSQAKVRSTTQRRGSTTNPFVRSERLTISVSS